MSSQEDSNKETECYLLSVILTEGLLSTFCDSEFCEGVVLEAQDLDEDEECAICSSSMNESSVTIIQPCQHYFCTTCIKEWRITLVKLNISS